MHKNLFLDELFKDSEGYINIREIDHNNNAKQQFLTLERAKNYKGLEDKHIYFGVYTRRKGNGKASGCISTGTLWADFDNMQLPEVKNRIHKADLPDASIYVYSGGGIHAYWLLTKPVKNDISGILQALATATGADAKTTDKARIMRLPDTMNIKYKPFRQCKVVEANGQRYDIELFETLLGARQEAATTGDLQEGIIELIQSKRHCIRNMAHGVIKGDRNFVLGRIVKDLQARGYTKRNAEGIIKRWNRLNDPPEQEKKLLYDFSLYWEEDYKLLGCSIKNPHLQQILYKYCSRPECNFSMAIGNIELDNSIEYNNRLLNDLHKLTGNDLIIYGLLVRHREGLTTSLLVEKLTARATGEPCMSKPTRIKSLYTLIKKGFVEVMKGNRREGKESLYKAIPQGTYGLGYTLMSNGAINGAIDGRVTAGELRLYVLLLRYAFNKGNCYPSLETLGKDLRTTPNNISILLNRLERVDYIKRDYKLFNGVEKLNIRLLV